MEKERKTKIVKTAIAGLTSMSMLVGATFDSPSELTGAKKIVAADDKKDFSGDILQGLTQQSSLKNKLKKLIYKIPVEIRANMFVPMWFLGTFLIFFLKLAVKIVIAPILKILLGIILHAAILIAIVLICVKLLFPDLPWSKILNKRNIILILAGSIIMSLCDFFMPMFWDKYNMYRFISKIIFGLLLLSLIMRPYIKKKLQNRNTYEIVYDNQTLELNA